MSKPGGGWSWGKYFCENHTRIVWGLSFRPSPTNVRLLRIFHKILPHLFDNLSGGCQGITNVDRAADKPVFTRCKIPIDEWFFPSGEYLSKNQ